MQASDNDNWSTWGSSSTRDHADQKQQGEHDSHVVDGSVDHVDAPHIDDTTVIDGEVLTSQHEEPIAHESVQPEIERVIASHDAKNSGFSFYQIAQALRSKFFEVKNAINDHKTRAEDRVVAADEIHNEDGVVSVKKGGIGATIERIKHTIFTQKESVYSVLFVSNDTYRWYVYDSEKAELSPVNEPLITHNVFVWDDKQGMSKNAKNKRAFKREMMREEGIDIGDAKRSNDAWYYFDKTLVADLQSMGFAKLYSLQMSADAQMIKSDLKPNMLVYFQTESMFCARVLDRDFKPAEQMLFNADEVSVRSVFTHVLTSNRVQANDQHVLKTTIADLIVLAEKQEGWLLEERYLGVTVLQLNALTIVFILLAGAGYLYLTGNKLVIQYQHSSAMDKLIEANSRIQSEYDHLYAQKRFYVANQLSINVDDFIAKAEQIHKPGLSIEGNVDYKGNSDYGLWWYNGKTPLTSFTTNRLPEGCEQGTKVAGNGEMAHKQINCIGSSRFVGRFDSR